MRILLLAMPDSIDVADRVARLPNLGIVSLAGNLPGHEVKVLDLVLRRPQVRAAVQEALATFRPQLVGLSAMTFQFETLRRLARVVRGADPATKIVAGGYHATLMDEEITRGADELPIDYMVRGEGELTLRELVAALEAGARPDDLAAVRGLTFRAGGAWVRNPPRPLADLAELALPDREARLADRFRFLGVPFDVVETSRGCPSNCTFCCISGMYGRTFRTFPLERVVEDLRRARARGARAIFLVDDNITHDVSHFRAVCRAIVEHRLNDLTYMVQVAAAGIARHPELVAEMATANFRYAFVGFEAMSALRLRQMRKPTSPELNLAASALLRRHGIAIVAGVVVGHPEDSRTSLREEFRQIRRLGVDMLYAQYLTPYPGTPLRQEMLASNLVVNPDDFTKYDGFTCNVRTRQLSREALHRTLKAEAMKLMLRPSQLWRNRLLRWHGRQLLASTAYNFYSDLYNILAARGLRGRLDL